MSVIPSIIPPQSFELVRDRISEILADEIANQFILSGDPVINATVFLERTVPVDKTDVPMVNVSLNRGELEGQVAVNTNDTLTFNIDCYHGSKTEGTERGDTLSILKLHKLMGVCRAILENPRYKTLGFASGFIMRRNYKSMDIAETGKQDASSISMARLSFEVRVPENTELISPVVAAGFDTQMQLELTDKGYAYTVDEP